MLKTPKNFLHYSKQCIDKSDIISIEKVLKSDFLTTGPEVEKFEKKLSKIVGSKYALVCSNGSVALYLAYLSLGLKKNTIVILPSITFAAAANAAKMLGFRIIFCDVSPLSGLVTKEGLEKTIIKNKIKGGLFVPVHLNGQSVDLEEINKVCHKYKLKIIEDASHALGTLFKSKGTISSIGACKYSSMTTFSFHPVKNITMGEGGAITTNNKDLFEKLILLRNNGIQRNSNFFQSNKFAFDNDKNLNPNYYEIQSIGLNFRASDINCALGNNQLNKLKKFVNKRNIVINKYDYSLKELKPLLCPIEKYEYSITSFHLYVVLINFDKLLISRAKMINILKKKKIGVQVHYPPLHLQKIYGSKKKLPGSEEYYSKCLSLPLFPQLQINEVEYITETIKDIILKYKKK
mgnify:CR=1 FL=1